MKMAWYVQILYPASAKYVTDIETNNKQVILSFKVETFVNGRRIGLGYECKLMPTSNEIRAKVVPAIKVGN